VVNNAMPDVSSMGMLSMMGFNSMGLNFRGNSFNVPGSFDTPTIGAALFHQSTYGFTDRLSVTLGIRLDYEHQSMDYNSSALVKYGFIMENPVSTAMAVNLQNLETDILYQGTLTNDYFRVLPKVALKYDLANGSNIYTSFAVGQRSGGYNLQMFSELIQGKMRINMMEGVKEGLYNYLTDLTTPGSDIYNSRVPQRIPYNGEMVALPKFVYDIMNEKMPSFEEPRISQVVYKPEYSWNYELGTHLNFWNYRLKLDAAVFYNRIYNQQIARFVPSGLGRMMVNAGESESCGGELSLTLQPVDALTLRGNYGYTHAVFLEYDDGKGVDYAGKYVPYVPMNNVNIDAEYRWVLQNSILGIKSLTVGVDAIGAGRIYWTENNNVSQPFYTTIGARVQAEISHFIVTLWGKNLADSKYNTFYFESSGRGFEQHCKPLQVGVDVNIKI